MRMHSMGGIALRTALHYIALHCLTREWRARIAGTVTFALNSGRAGCRTLWWEARIPALQSSSVEPHAALSDNFTVAPLATDDAMCGAAGLPSHGRSSHFAVGRPRGLSYRCIREWL